MNKLIFAVLAIIILLSVPLWLSEGPLFIFSGVLIEVIFALSWNLMFGYAGITSFGHAAFFAIGAYGAGYALTTGLPIPFIPLLVLLFVVGAAAAALVGFVALKRSVGNAFAIATLAIAEILRIAISQSGDLGREDGMAGIVRPQIGPIHLDTTVSYYWFLAVACIISVAVLYWLCVGQFGRTLRSMRQDAVRAEFIGINVARHRVVAFAVAGGFAALAGALYAPLVQIVTPEVGGYLHSAQPMLSALLGGVSSFWGPVVGVGIFSAISYFTRTLPGTSEFVTGAILLTIILITPSGIFGMVRNLTRRRAIVKAPTAEGQEAK